MKCPNASVIVLLTKPPAARVTAISADCSGLPVVRYGPGELHAQFGDAFQLLDHQSEDHRTPSGAIQQFVYCVCLVH